MDLDDVFGIDHDAATRSDDFVALATMEELQKAFNNVMVGLEKAIKEDEFLHCPSIRENSANLEMIGSVYGWAGGIALTTGHPLGMAFGEVVSLLGTAASIIDASPGISRAKKECEQIQSQIKAHEYTRDILLREIGKSWQEGHKDLSNAKQNRKLHKQSIQKLDAQEYELRKRMYALNPVGRPPSMTLRAFKDVPDPSEASMRKGASFFVSAVPVK
jgi:hypothetical protein